MDATDQSPAGEASAAAESEFEARLRQLQPAACQIEAARLMFEAGRIVGSRKSAHRSNWLWPTTTAAALLVAVTSVATHWIGPGRIEPQLQVAQQTAVDPQQEVPASEIQQAAPPNDELAPTAFPPAPVVKYAPNPWRASWPQWEQLLAEQARPVAALPASSDAQRQQPSPAHRSRMTSRELLKDLRRDMPDLRFAESRPTFQSVFWLIDGYGPIGDVELGF